MVGQCGDGFRRIVIENDMLAFCLRRYRDGDQFRQWRGWGPVDIARQPRRNGFSRRREWLSLTGCVER